MKSISLRHIYVLLVLMFFSIKLSSQKLTFVLGEYIVQVEEGITPDRLARLLYTMDGINIKPEVSQIATSPMNLLLVKTDHKKINQPRFSAFLKSTKGVLTTQRNRIFEKRNTPNDVNFPLQWQLQNTGQSGGMTGADIKMLGAWNIATGGTTVNGDTIVVCVIDDGVDINHPDMIGNLWINHGEIPGDGIDNDNNGYIDDYLGWNVATKSDNITADGSHGTPVAGIIGAIGNNEIGVSGVNWNVKLMIVDYGATTEANALAAYAYPYAFRKKYNETNGAEGAFVVSTNASWGLDLTKPEDAPLWCAIYDSLGAVGILNAGATANRNVNVDLVGDLPTACESEYLISVTNVNRFNNKVNSAGFGRKSIDLGAYGSEAYTVRKGGGYGAFGGTSSATPHVAGAIALIYSTPCPGLMNMSRIDPAAAALMVKDMILGSVSPNATLAGITTTGGVLNVEGAMQKSLSLCDTCSTVLVPVITEGFDPQEIFIRLISPVFSIPVHLEIVSLNGLNDTIIVSGNVDDVFNVRLDGLCTEYQLRIAVACGTDSLNLDNQYFRFFKTPGCCDAPLNLNHKVVEGGLEILLNTLLDQQSYLFEYKFNDVDSDWQIIETEENVFFLPLEECQAIIYRARRYCGKFNTVSEYSKLVHASTKCGFCTSDIYCTGLGLDNSDEWIDTFSFGPIFNASGPQNGAYGLFSHPILPVFRIGDFYSFRLVNAYAGVQYDEYYLIYLDANQDGFFSEEERLYISDNPTRVPAEGNLHIPDDALEGITRLRVILSYDRPNGPCVESGFQYGEIEDYCILLQRGEVTCNAPQDIRFVENTVSSVVLSIDNYLEIDSVRIDYREKDAQEWESKIFSAVQILRIEQLDSCKTYEFIFYSLCGNIISEVSESRFFETSCTTGTTNIIKTPKVNIFPNPFTDRLYIDYTGLNIESLRIELVNTKGETFREIKFQKLEYPLRGVELLLPENIPSGLYFVKIINEKSEVSAIKVVKM